jgi:hypothetical protein
MKHILNDLTEQEKNAIREQHAGGMKVMTENFSKLTNSKLGDSKPLVSEQSEFEELGNSGHDYMKVMNFAYHIINEEAPEGPRNAEKYLSAIHNLEQSFQRVIRNLKGNVRGGF